MHPRPWAETESSPILRCGYLEAIAKDLCVDWKRGDELKETQSLDLTLVLTTGNSTGAAIPVHRHKTLNDVQLCAPPKKSCPLSFPTIASFCGRKLLQAAVPDVQGVARASQDKQ